ncbi:hypothetical protein Egran_04356 [Elaphomyces granulatus]|uniref:Transcription factor domain-containing protein n=1 Tax=Elaphomyces granulatus TaxID=519963 RepID=A0A232LUM9_9EURO|nr:hypothetical protein Egran_04356 [Elaphomyces granulatus]
MGRASKEDGKQLATKAILDILQELEDKIMFQSEQEDDGGLSIPVEHTTAAHNLLLWPSIKCLLPDEDYDYVMKLEEDRGLIRVYGRGVDDPTEAMIPAPSSPPDESRVRRLHRSYLQHIHILHPFLGETILQRKVDEFLEIYSKPKKPHRGTKRKRSSEPLPWHPWRIGKSIDNAIVLLVLALGAICEWRDKPLPGPVSDSAGGALNVDIIPGLVYYAYATDILGNLQGGNDLPHVQAALLASLYAGQLAHSFQSHGWISQASRACQVLIRT